MFEWYFLSLILFFHQMFWGVGLSFVLLPGRRLHHWMIYSLPMSFALQSAVVWFFLRSPWRGLNDYGPYLLILPVVLLIAGLLIRRKDLSCAWANGWKMSVQLLVMSLAVFIMMIHPITGVAEKPTSVSLGSCDLASYAGGVESFRQFGLWETTGFLGQQETVLNATVPNFQSYWMSNDHFAPVAITALNASILKRTTPRVMSLHSVLFWVALIPLVFGVLWRVLGVRFSYALCGAFFFGISLHGMFAAYQAMLGQMIGTSGFTLLFFELMQTNPCITRNERWLQIFRLTVGNVLVLGAYAFFLPIGWVVLGCLLGLRWWLQGRSAREAWGICKPIVLSLALACLLMPERILSLSYWFFFLGGNSFGWEIPLLIPSGWFGLFDLESILNAKAVLVSSQSVLSWGIASGLMGLMAYGAWEGRGKRKFPWILQAGYLVLAVGGYVFLAKASKGGGGVNCGYHAYKFFSVLYPVCYAILISGLLAFEKHRRQRVWRAGGLCLLTVVYGLGFVQMGQKLRQPPLQVDAFLSSVKEARSFSQVKAVNIDIPDSWSRLWINALLLQKEQFFPDITYEMRNKSEFKAPWTLTRAMITVIPEGADRLMWVNPLYYLLDASVAENWSGRFDPTHWFGEEQYAHHLFRWNDGRGTVFLTKRQGPQSAKLRLQLSGADAGRVEILFNEKVIFDDQVSGNKQYLPVIPLEFVEGENRLEFRSDNVVNDPEEAGRTLGLALYRVEILLGETVSERPMD